MNTTVKNQRAQAMLLMHFCVLLWGFTAILGKVISISALNLVLWRVFLAGLCLYLYMRLRGQRIAKLDAKLHGTIFITGALIGLHWVAFYGSVKLANASIGVLCMCCAPIFSALLTPLFERGKIRWFDVLMALTVLPGMLAVVGGVSPRFYAGIALGVLAALLVAAFGLMNKRLVEQVDVLGLSILQMLSAGLLLLIPALLSGFALPTSADWPILLLFAVLCTAMPFVWAASALKHLSAFSAQFAINLEPVYGIVLAALLLGETSELSLQFYLGALGILLAVALQGYLQIRRPVQDEVEAVACDSK